MSENNSGNDITTWMVKDVIKVQGTNTIVEASMLMKKNNIGAAIVLEGKEPVGIFTERDLLNKVVSKGKDYKTTLVKDVMSADIKTASIDMNYKDVYDLMVANQIRHLPIVKEKELVGIVSIRDLLRFNTRTMEQTIIEQKKEIDFIKSLMDKSNNDRNRELYVENERLQGLIRVDDLTGLYNHKYFEEILVKEVSRAKRYNRPVTLLFLDIDHFKHYNDINGHQQGNIVLKQLAELLRNTSRRSDTAFKMTAIDIVARYGGEEFVIILPETNKSGGYARAERILKDVRDFEFNNGKAQPNGRLTVSLGVAEFPEDCDSWSSLIKKADEQLYKAKNSGRDKIC